MRRVCVPDVPIPYSRSMEGLVMPHAGRIRGMEDPEAKMLLMDLSEFATQPQFVHTHVWKVGDLVMWDNRCTLHRGTDFDDMRFVRDMRRATVGDVANTCEQAGVAVPA